MLDLSARKRGSNGKQLLPNGVYNSVVVDVKWANGYEPEEAYEITYELTSEDGILYRHHEIFMTDERNRRTAAFEEYIFDHGIEVLSDFTGKHEKLTIQRVKVGSREFANIVDREFVYA